MSRSERWSARRPVLFGVAALFVLVGGFGLWAATARLSGAVVAAGQIEVDQNRQVVQHPDGGVVAEILVNEGNVVVVDQRLIRLDGTALVSDLSVIEGQYYEVMARSGRLEAERDRAETITFAPELLAAAERNPDYAALIEGQRRLFETRVVSLGRELEQMGKQREQIASQIEGITAQIGAIDTQIGLAAQDLERQEDLLKSGLAQLTRVLDLKRETAALQGRRGELVAAKAEAGERSTEIEIAAERLKTARQEEAIATLRDLGYNNIELAEKRRALIEKIGRLEIRAPVAGVVYNMQIFAPRSVIRPAEAVLYIVPQDRPLVISVRISPLNVDQVRVGQDVDLRFSSFDSRTTPELTGTVFQLSADVFTDERLGSYYRAQVRLKEGEINRLPPGLVLVPGMPVEAFIRTQDRTPLEYLVKPMADYFNRAFREG